MTHDPGHEGTGQSGRDDSTRDPSSAKHPNQPASDEADRAKETTPAGIEGELEDKAEELGASTEPPGEQS